MSDFLRGEHFQRGEEDRVFVRGAMSNQQKDLFKELSPYVLWGTLLNKSEEVMERRREVSLGVLSRSQQGRGNRLVSEDEWRERVIDQTREMRLKRVAVKIIKKTSDNSKEMKDLLWLSEEREELGEDSKVSFCSEIVRDLESLTGKKGE
jgi:hypothetical protein